MSDRPAPLAAYTLIIEFERTAGEVVCHMLPLDADSIDSARTAAVARLRPYPEDNAGILRMWVVESANMVELPVEVIK